MIERDWNIQPPCGQCCVTGRHFADEEPFFTMLVEGEKGLERKDFSTEAWAQRDPARKPVSFWRSEFKLAPVDTPRTIAQDDAESLLRRMIESDDPATVNARYILAVMLERKKTLYHRDTIARDGSPWLVYEHKETGETFLVADPRLRLAELHAIQQEVAELLRPRPAHADAPPAAAPEAAGNPAAAPENGAGELPPESIAAKGSA